MCQVIEDVDPLSVWNLLLADGVIGVTPANKLVYRKPKVGEPAAASMSLSSYKNEDPNARKPALTLVRIQIGNLFRQ